MRKSPLLALLSAGLAAALAFPAHAEKKEQFDVCWTIYAGWMPWEYGATQGIVVEELQPTIPLKVGENGDYYRIYVGFMLTEQELAYNRKNPR